MAFSVDTNFFSYLLEDKTSLSKLDKEEEKEMWGIAKNYLYSGFLINSLSFSKSNFQLFNSLEKHNRAFFINYLIMKKSLAEITKEFNKEKISFVLLKGMALNIEKIFLPGIRQHRDIDLLVKKEDIGKAYKILRQLKFKYSNTDTSDNADYLLKHHLPPMRNEFGIILELHWRITDVNSFKKCPLTNSFFEKRTESKLMKGVFIPSQDCLVAHALYHGIQHHKFTHGPIFIFDLAAIYKFNKCKWPDNENLINKLGLVTEFEKCKKIISVTQQDNRFTEEIKNLIKEMLKDFNWEFKSKEKIKIFLFNKKDGSSTKFLERIYKRINFTSHNYQLPKTSLKFWFYFLRDLFLTLKRISF